MKSEICVEVIAVEKCFKDFWGRPKKKAVQGIRFKVRKGDVFALLGTNGSGKTTTLNLLVGLLFSTKGQISILGESPRESKHKKRIGYLPEELSFGDHLTAQECLEFFAALYEIPKKERRHRSSELINKLGLDPTLKVRDFSKGMNRLLGIAQALINDPELIILDEPFSGLDPLACRRVKKLLKSLSERGKTIILSSHLLTDIEGVVDRVCVLHEGKIQVEGKLEDLLTFDDMTEIISPKLDPKLKVEVLTLLNENFTPDQVQLKDSKMSLEDFFLKLQDIEVKHEKVSSPLTELLRKEDPIGLNLRPRNSEESTEETSKNQREKQNKKLEDLLNKKTN